MTHERYIAEYMRWIDKWNEIKNRNEKGDYSCGYATTGKSCDKIVIFDNDTEKDNYLKKYGND